MIFTFKIWLAANQSRDAVWLAIRRRKLKPFFMTVEIWWFSKEKNNLGNFGLDFLTVDEGDQI